jgi:ATP-dependent helicase/nuclease subunit B
VFAGAAGEAGGVPPALRLVAARDFESEALAAAAVIRRLVFEEGFRYRDILVLCNDPGRRASAIKRVFDACGLPVFFDRRRDVDHNPVLEYILVLPEILARGRRSEDVFRWIRTGLVPIAPADAEELENYALRYRLRGTAWGKPLRRGAKEYEEEVFARIGAAARQVAEMLDAFATRFSAGRTARERTEGLRAYLVEDARLPVMIEQLAAALEADGYDEYAAEMRGIRDIAEGILDQIAGSLGDLVMGMEEYAVVLRAGFASVKMGVLPPTSDRVVVGTMQRTRTGSARAMLVLGANDGLLPMFESSDDLIGDEEKEALEELGFSAFRSAGNLMHEERLAIYKNLSKPTRLLYLSYTDAGMGGETAGSSQVFTRLHRLFPDVPVEVADEVPVYGVLAEAPDAGGAQRIAPELLRALLAAQGGAGDDGAGGGDDGAGGGGALTLSTSAIERYSRCPLSWFLGSGLKLSERRIFAVDSRNIGEAYHEVLMEFGKAMSADGLPVSDPASRWRLSARADTDRMIDGIYEALSERLFEGVFRERPQDRYRGTRLVRVLKEVAWALTERVRESGTETLLFEQAFDGLTLGGGVQARGRIDRIDVLADGRAKVLDYKSGGDRFSFDEIESGWQLQLMLYLKAVADTYSYEPAGVSYFPVKEAHVNLSGDKAPRTPEEIEESIRGAYRSDGFAVGSPEDAAPGERVVSAGEFASLRETVDALLGALAADIAAGDTSARPKTSGHKSARGEEINACTYCRFRSVCGRDMS